ncbi:MAG: dockerin type I domain-containing protein, partial [Planctomycetota bacterium]
DGVPGNQFVTVPVSVASGDTPIDGTIETSFYGPALFVSNTGTGFGNASNPDVIQTGGDGFDAGSEISAVYATLADTDTDGSADVLYIAVAGNLEENFNKLNLVFDVDFDAAMPEGQNVLLDTNNGDAFGQLTRHTGLEFDAGFTADLILISSLGDDTNPNDGIFSAFVDIITIPTNGGGISAFVGGQDQDPQLGTLPIPLVNTDAVTSLGGGISLAINNSNTGGVGATGFTPDIPSRDVSVGSELNAIYSYVDTTNNRLNVLFSGNLQSNGNRLVVFFDADPTDGQNVIRDDNVNIAFNLLDRLGPNDGSNPDIEASEVLGDGLTFDTDFNADYIIAFDNSGLTPSTNSVFANAAVLRLNGPITVQGSIVTDFGSFDGGNKQQAGNDPLLFDGDLDLDGFGVNTDPALGPDPFTNFAPRNANTAFTNNGFTLGSETPGLLQIAIDNSNVGGVTASDAGTVDTSDACNVTTGVEISIDLGEVGWDGTSDIKILGVVADSSASQWSNQISGGLPTTDGLGEVRNIDLSTVAGNQFITTADTGDCPSARLCGDVNDDGVISDSDFFAWVTAFIASPPSPADIVACDVNNDGNCNDSDFFAWVTEFINAGGGGPLTDCPAIP